MRLLLDLGNTRLKWALQQDASWLAQGAVAWGAQALASLTTAWSNLPAVQMVVAASVVDASREQDIANLTMQLWSLPPRWARTPPAACGVRNGYAAPQRLGVDRFLALVAAHAAGRGPCVLAGIGTALTLDALTADGRHLGGLIAPGPQLMQQSVLGATAQVRPGQAGKLVNLADNTADGLYSGCWHATAALVERFVARVAPLLGGQPTLSLDGGDAGLLQPLLDYPSILVSDGVLHGLAVWAREPIPPSAA